MSINVNVTLADELLIKHIINERLAANLNRKVYDLLKDAEKDIIDKTARIDPTAPKASRYKKQRLEKLQIEVDRILSEHYKEISKETNSSLKDIADYNYQRTAALLNTTVMDVFSVKISKNLLNSVVNNTLIDGGLVKDWWKKQKDNTSDAVKRMFQEATREMQIGIIQRETVGELITRIKGTKGRPGILDIPRRQAEALVRTSVLTVSNQANDQVYKEHQDIFNGWEIVAILDRRTTRLCQGLHGRKYTLDYQPIGHNIPYPVAGGPPFHWNALVKGTKILTSKGEIPIEDVKVGDRVLTHTGQFKYVYSTMSKTIRNKMIRIFNTDSGRILSGTYEHPILTFFRGWKTFGDVQVGDKVFQYTKDSFSMKDSTLFRLKIPNDYPFEIDEAPVSYDITSFSIPIHMTFPINFQNNFMFWKGKISNVYANGILKDIISIISKKFNNFIFVFSGIISKMFTQRFGHFFSNVFSLRRIIFRHSFAVGCDNGTSFFSFAKSWMGSCGSCFSQSNTRSFSLRSVFDSKFFTIIVDFIRRNREVSGYFSDRFSSIKMFFRNKIFKKSFIHIDPPSCWKVSKILSIEEKKVKEIQVYNLAVDEDETYIAENCIVHNCRTIKVPITKSYEQLVADAGLERKYGRKLDQLKGKETKLDTKRFETTDKWLQSLPKSKQIEILGPGRYKLWKQNKISTSQMIKQDGRPLTLVEMNNKKFLAQAQSNRLQIELANKPLTENQIKKASWNIKDKTFKPTLDKMIKNGAVVKDRYGRYVLKSAFPELYNKAKGLV